MERNSAKIWVGVGLIAAMMLAGCSSGTGSNSDVELAEGTCLDEAPADGPRAGTAVRDSFEGVTLTFAGTGGTYQEAQDEAYLKPFSACTGATILQTQLDTTKLRAMVESGNVEWNVQYAGANIVANNCEALAETIDTSKVDLSESSGLLTECQVPAAREGTYLVYNESMFGEDPPTGMADFFDTEKYPGKRLFHGDPSYVDTGWMAVAAELGWTEESGEPFPYEGVVDKIASLGDDLVTFQTGAQLVQMLEQGDIAMAYAWAGRAYSAAKNGAPYTPVFEAMTYPRVDLSIPKGAPDLDASYALINFIMGAEQQATLSEMYVYSPDNVNAKPDIPADMAPFVPSEEDYRNAIETSKGFWYEPSTTKRMLELQQELYLGGNS